MQKKTLSHILFFLFAFGCLGYFREFFFVHINNIMYQKYHHTTSHLETPAIMRIFFRFDYATLYYSKYIYTMLWTVIFFLLNYFAIKKLTGKTQLVKLLVYSYLAMFLLAVLSMLIGIIVNGRWQDDEYTLSRWLMGIAQSPIICLILLGSEKLYNKSFQS